MHMSLLVPSDGIGNRSYQCYLYKLHCLHILLVPSGASSIWPHNIQCLIFDRKNPRYDIQFILVLLANATRT